MPLFYLTLALRNCHGYENETHDDDVSKVYGGVGAMCYEFVSLCGATTQLTFHVNEMVAASQI